MQTLILAKNITEANRYAKLVGLERFTYRAVRSAGAIRGIRNAEVHILPSFMNRLDRHAILAALRHARTLEVFYVDPADLLGPEYLELQQKVRLGDLTDKVLDEAYLEKQYRDFPQRHLTGFDQADPRGPLTDEVLDEAYREQASRATTSTERVNVAGGGMRLTDAEIASMAGELTDEEGDPIAPVIKRRRSRCAECGELYFASDPAAAAEHEHKAPVAKPVVSDRFF